MFSDKENVNILTSLLVAHSVCHAVVCPGSRNAPIVHNLDACGSIHCYPVTDERSAGFYALGLCQAVNAPVVVCVTSGTALLNLCPSVAEAFYQHLPLVVISADRPAQWIGQLDGQTLPQVGALGRFVSKTVNLPEPHDEESRWYCNRLINEAMIACIKGSCGPVHINVPITEPLYQFNTNTLPIERKITFLSGLSDFNAASVLCFQPIVKALKHAQKPLIIIGQMKPSVVISTHIERLISQQHVILYEPLSVDKGDNCLEETMCLIGDKKEFLPDFILYFGDTFVSKRLKEFLRKAKKAECWIVNPEGVLYDTFMNLTGIAQAEPKDIMQAIDFQGNTEWFNLWENMKQHVRKHRMVFEPHYSNMLAVKQLEALLSNNPSKTIVHYANSTSIRLGCIYARHHIFCNRGVNGIEGSLSTAAGYSLVTKEQVFCIIGDLSFFYDQNALWNQNLGGNLRILLLNNHGGEIFAKFEGLKLSPVRNRIVMAEHATTAEGICRDNRIKYYAANNIQTLEKLLYVLVKERSERPMLLEVFTDAETDLQIYQEYLNTL